MGDLARYYATVNELIHSNPESVIAQYFETANLNDYLASHDNWNGGIDFYNVQLYVSVAAFTYLKQHNLLVDACNEIMEAFNDSIGNDGSTNVNDVDILPSAHLVTNAQNSQMILPTYWKNLYYRVFLSHLTANKVSAANLKEALLPYGISSFVAHEDITVAKPWQDELEKALNTMDALVAIFETGFKDSDWCCQEIGWALGRNVPVVPIARTMLPYGFVGAIQAIKPKVNSDARDVAREVVKALLSNEKHKGKYIDTICRLLLISNEKQELLEWIQLLTDNNVQSSDILYLSTHASENDALMSTDVLPRLNSLLEQKGLEGIKVAVRQSMSDDDLPF